MFEKISELAEITVLPLEGNIQVGWKNTLLEDGEVVSAKIHYVLYSAGQKEEFLVEVPGAEQYVAAVGW